MIYTMASIEKHIAAEIYRMEIGLQLFPNSPKTDNYDEVLTALHRGHIFIFDEALYELIRTTPRTVVKQIIASGKVPFNPSYFILLHTSGNCEVGGAHITFTTKGVEVTGVPNTESRDELRRIIDNDIDMSELMKENLIACAYAATAWIKSGRVPVQEVVIPDKVLKKRQKTGKLAGVKKYTLIGGFSPQQEVQHESGTGDKKAAHWRRGHFKARKTGVYWWNPHVAGEGPVKSKVAYI